MTTLPLISLERAESEPGTAPARRRAALPPRHLADMDLSGRRAAVVEHGAEGVPGEPDVHALLRSIDSRSGRDDRHSGGRAGPVDRCADACAAHAGPRAVLRRRGDPQDAMAPARRLDGRERADGLSGPRHGLRIQPGRMRDGLPVLRDRAGRPHPEPVHRRDRRPGRLVRRAWPREANCPDVHLGCRGSSSWAWANRSPTTPE